jgi:hypothetical protein
MSNSFPEIVERALNVVKTNPDWIAYVKAFNHPAGFLFCDDKILDDIAVAVDKENPVHSGSTIALCLQKCKIILNNL